MQIFLESYFYIRARMPTLWRKKQWLFGSSVLLYGMAHFVQLINIHCLDEKVTNKMSYWSCQNNTTGKGACHGSLMTLVLSLAPSRKRELTCTVALWPPHAFHGTHTHHVHTDNKILIKERKNSIYWQYYLIDGMCNEDNY